METFRELSAFITFSPAVAASRPSSETLVDPSHRLTVEKKLAKKPHIAKALIPSFAVGCRRLTPGPGYLEALCEDHVDFIPTAIERITATGIQCKDGTCREYDTIVCATGFDTSYRPRIPIVGRNGNNLQDLWDAPAPPHYLSMLAGPDHPNFVSRVTLRRHFSPLLPGQELCEAQTTDTRRPHCSSSSTDPTRLSAAVHSSSCLNAKSTTLSRASTRCSAKTTEPCRPSRAQ